MVESSPFEVQELVPDATTEQVWSFFDLVGKSSKTTADDNLALREGLAIADLNKSLFEQLRELDRQR